MRSTRTNNWMNARLGQNTFGEVSTLPAVARSGPESGRRDSPQTEDKDGKTKFVVGKSTVGDGSVAT